MTCVVRTLVGGVALWAVMAVARFGSLTASAQETPAPAAAAEDPAPPTAEAPAPEEDAAAPEVPAAEDEEPPPVTISSEVFDQKLAEFNKVFDQFRANLLAMRREQVRHLIASYSERQLLAVRYNQLRKDNEQLLEKLVDLSIVLVSADQQKANAPLQLLYFQANNYFLQDNYERCAEATRPIETFILQDAQASAEVGRAAFALGDFKRAARLMQNAVQKKTKDEKVGEYLNILALAQKSWEEEQAIRQAEAAADDLPRVLLSTNRGDITLELFENEAPNTVANFISLVEAKFYDGLTFHRVLPAFMAQGGDPRGDGSGGPPYFVPCECQGKNARRHFRGSLSMAHAGPNTGGSQFFLCFSPQHHLDGKHTVFGRVIAGMEVLSMLNRIDPEKDKEVEPDRIEKATVLRKRDHPYQPIKLPARPVPPQPGG